MFFDEREGWRSFPQERLPQRVREVLARFAQTSQKVAIRLIKPFLDDRPQAGSVIEKVSWRELGFYVPASESSGQARPVLVQLFLRRDMTKESVGDTAVSSPQLFLLGIPDPNDDEALSDVLHLDGSSVNVLRAAESCGGIHPEFAHEYLDFYTSMVAGEEGPTEVIRMLHIDELGKDIENREPHIGASIVARSLLELVPPERPDEDAGRQRASEETDDEGLRAHSSVGQVKRQIVDSVKAVWALGSPVTERTGIVTPSESFLIALAHGRGDPEQTLDGLFEKLSTYDGGAAVVLGAVVRYGRSLFQALFVVHPGGEIEEIARRQLLGHYGALPIAAWRPIERPDLLGQARAFQRTQRIANDPDEGRVLAALEKLRTERDVKKTLGGRPVRIEGERLDHGLDWRGETFHRPLEFEDCDFHGDVLLSDAVLERGLSFRNCRFLGALRLENTRIGGPLVISRCSVTGLRERTKMRVLRRRYAQDPVHGLKGIDETVALDLRGMRVQGNLRLERVRVSGSVTLRGIRVEGRGMVHGCEVWPFYELRDSSTSQVEPLRLGLRFLEAGAALDLRSGRFEQGLTLSAWFDPAHRQHDDLAKDHLQQCEPTLVVGTVRAEHLYVGEALEMSGLICTKLDADTFTHTPNRSYHGIVALGDAEIKGPLRVWLSSAGPHDAWKYLRTILTRLDLTRASIRSGDLRGLYLERDLSAPGLRCDGVLNLSPIGQHRIDTAPADFARWKAPVFGARPLLDLPAGTLRQDGRTVARFGRTQIGGGLDFRGARVTSDVYLDGVYVARDVYFNDAEIGGLSMSVAVSAWRADARGELQYVPQEDVTRPGVLSGPEAHLFDNPLSCHYRPVTPHAGLLTMAAQARRLHLQDATVHGPVKLAGVLLLGQLGPDRPDPEPRLAQIERILMELGETGALSEERMGELLGPQPEPREKDERSFYEEALWITNTAIEGPLLLFRERLPYTLAARIGRQPMDSMAFSKLLVMPLSQDELGAELEVELARWLPEWASRSRIMGGAYIYETKIDGQLEMRATVVDGPLRVIDVELMSDLTGSRSTSRAVFARSVDLESLDTPGDVYLDRLITRELAAPNMQLGGALYMRRAQIRDLVGIETLRTPSDVHLDRIQTERLRASNLSVGGSIHMLEVRIAGNADLEGSRADVLALSTSWEDGYEPRGVLSLQRCTIDELQLELKKIPHQLDLRTSVFQRLGSPKRPEDSSGEAEPSKAPPPRGKKRKVGSTSSYKLIEEILEENRMEYDAKVYWMFETLLRTEGENWGADEVRRKKEQRQLEKSREQVPWVLRPFASLVVWIVSKWTSQPRELSGSREFVDRFLNMVAGMLGRAFAITLLFGLLTVGSSFLFVAGSRANWKDGATCSETALMALELGFPPFGRTEGEAALLELAKVRTTHLGTNACGGPSLAEVPVSPGSVAKGCRATGFVLWSWFLLIATGLMRRGGGIINE